MPNHYAARNMRTDLYVAYGRTLADTLTAAATRVRELEAAGEWEFYLTSILPTRDAPEYAVHIFSTRVEYPVEYK